MGRIFTEDSSDQLYGLTQRSLLTTLLIGAVSGMAAWGLMVVIDKFILTPIFCTNDANISVCVASTQIAANLATVIVGVAAIPVLLRAGVSRVVLVAIASIVALWGISAWIVAPWYVGLVVTAITYALVYAALAWLCRIRNVLLVAVLVVVFALLARLIVSL